MLGTFEDAVLEGLALPSPPRLDEEALWLPLGIFFAAGVTSSWQSLFPVFAFLHGADDVTSSQGLFSFFAVGFGIVFGRISVLSRTLELDVR